MALVEIKTGLVLPSNRVENVIVSDCANRPVVIFLYEQSLQQFNTHIRDIKIYCCVFKSRSKTKENNTWKPVQILAQHNLTGLKISELLECLKFPDLNQHDALYTVEVQNSKMSV